MKILIIDHDPRIQRKLTRILKDDFIVEPVSCAADAEDVFFSNHFDLVIMDIVLPDMEGADLVTLFKSYNKELPIIIISNKKSVKDKELAFERGVDDYLEKPVNISELRMRIKAHLRRTNNHGSKVYVKEIKLGELLLDRDKKAAFYNGVRIKLRKKELHLLEYLMLNKGRVVTRGDILENIWDANASPFTNTVDVHIKRLRDKIEKPYNVKYIETIHGIGYLVE